MIEDLGESGRLALTFARLAAIELSAPAVGTEHLFLGVAGLEDVSIRDRLLGVDVDIEKVSAEVRRAAGGPKRRAPGEPVQRLAFTPASERALETARQEAARLGGALVEAPHILLGVIRDESGVAARKLEEAVASRRREALLPPLVTELRRMLEAGGWSSDFYRERTAIEQPAVSKTSTVLESLGRDLTASARRGELTPVTGRERELRELVHVLCGSRKNNAVLVGEAGVGKTAIVEGLAQRLVAHQAPEQLAGMDVRTIEVGSLVAGTQYRGMFEAKLKALVDEVRDRTDVILFIDELHMLVGAGRAEGVVMDAADMLKPALTEGTLKVIGATTSDEFRRYIERDQALMRRFQPIAVGEPSREETVRILEGLRGRYEEFHGVKIRPEALAAAVDLSVRYLGDRYLPDKALDLLDRACTEEKLGAGIQEWMPSLAPPREERTVDLVVDAEEIAEVVSIMLEIPIATLTQDESNRLAGIGGALKKRVIGQDEAVDRVADATRAAFTREPDPKRPYGVFLFLGPSGVGKTRLAEELAAYLFGDRDELIRFDMSEYSEPYTVASLIGTPAGYAGWEEGGRLTNAVRSKPYSVLMLDSIEEAHPNVRAFLREAFEEGTVRDQAGRRVDFRGAVIVMTSNVGAERARPMGFGVASDVESDPDKTERELVSELRKIVGQGFLDQIDERIVFKPLSKESLRAIARLVLEEMIPMKLEPSDNALDFLVDESDASEVGVRTIRRTIQRLVRNPLSLMLARAEIAQDDTVAVTVSDGALRFARAGRKEEVALEAT